MTVIDTDYEKAPNPVKFLVVLQELSVIVDDYTNTVSPLESDLILGLPDQADHTETSR